MTENKSPIIEDDIDPNRKTKKLKSYTAQLLASTIKNLCLVDLGIAVTFSTIVIPALRGTIETDEKLHFTDEQASWFGSIIYICQPCGSLLSGVISDWIGRKRAMIFINIPYAAGWITFYLANSAELLFLAQILLGLSVGLTESPNLTYIGEISQPSVRGLLISIIGICLTIGNSLSYVFGSLTTWRNAAIMCLAVPIIIAIAICFIPETPIWLLSKNREEDALNSLRWLRGWVSPQEVEKEFNEMKMYNEIVKKCTPCCKANKLCDHPPATFTQKLKDLLRKKTLKAFLVVLGLFVFAQLNGVLAMGPFLVQIFKAYRVPMDPNLATVYFGVVSIIANIIVMITINRLGKRIISLTGFVGSMFCTIILGAYAQTKFPENYNSFELIENSDIEENVFPLIMFFAFSFFMNYGVYSIPWIILGEVFTFKVRGLACGVCAAINYVFYFIGTKTYVNLDKGLSLSGVMWFYSVMNFFAVIFVFFIVPETESCTLEDIEDHFADNSKKIWDLNIPKSLEKLDNTQRNKNENLSGYVNQVYTE